MTIRNHANVTLTGRRTQISLKKNVHIRSMCKKTNQANLKPKIEPKIICHQVIATPIQQKSPNDRKVKTIHSIFQLNESLSLEHKFGPLAGLALH